MSHYPTAGRLYELLCDLVQWELVAIHLRGITEIDIQKIQRESALVDQQKLSLYFKWLEKCPDASWGDVVTALEKGGKVTLADKVKKETAVLVHVANKNTSVVVKLQKEEEKIIDAKLEKLHDSFAMLFREVRRKIEKNAKKDGLHEVAKNINDANIDGLTSLTKCKSVDEMIDKIRTKCSFLDGSVLYKVIKFGLSENNTALLEKAQKHKEEAVAFVCAEPLKKLKGKLRDTKGDLHSHLTIKVNEEWNNIRINHVQQLVRRLADIDDMNVKLMEVGRGCTKIIFSISDNRIKSFEMIATQNKQLMHLIGVLYLQIEKNPPIFQEDENMNYTFEYGLLEAAKTGHIQAIEFILSIGIDVDYQNNEGKTALLLSSEHGHSETVKLILSAGASVDIKDNNGLTAVMVAKTVDIYQTLVQANANTNIVTNRGSTPLMMSCFHGNHDVANYLLFTLNYNITTRPDGVTLLMAASQGGNNKIVEYLLNNGHDPNIQDNDGRIAIQLSCLKGHYTVTEILLKHNADPSIPDNNGWTPLMSAIQEGHHVIVDLLLSNGAKPDIQDNYGETAIQLSCFNGYYTVTEILLKHNADPSIPNNDGWTPLMNASHMGHHKIVELLLQKGVDPNARNNKNGHTALMLASGNGHNETVKLLLSNGAKPNIQNNDGDTAIQLSCLNGHYTVTKILLQHNADPTLHDNCGNTPIMLAIDNERYDIVVLLVDNGVTHDEDTTMEPMVTPISSTGYHKKLNIIKYNSQHPRINITKTEHNRLSFSQF